MSMRYLRKKYHKVAYPKLLGYEVNTENIPNFEKIYFSYWRCASNRPSIMTNSTYLDQTAE